MGNKKQDLMQRRGAIVLVATAPSYVICGLTHVCMAGHMQHPPYPAWQYANDVFWVIGFFISAVLCYGSNFRLRWLTVVSLIILGLSRLLLGSGGGILLLIELPVLAIVLLVAVWSLFSGTTDWAAAHEGERENHRKTVRRAWRLVGPVVLLAGFLLWAGSRAAQWLREIRTPIIEISETAIPASQEIVLAPGNASVLRLPNGKTIALWGTSSVGFFRWFSRGDADFEYGERPFEPLQSERILLPDGATTFGEYLSYIRQGSVIYEGSRSPTQYLLYVDKYRVSLRPSEADEGKIRITVSVETASEKEQVPRPQQRDYYLKRLRSDDPAVRHDAVHELGEMVSLGSIYAGNAVEIGEAIRPLLKDPDSSVREEAKVRLRVIGDEQALLEMLTPKPEGEFFAKNGAWTIAAWCSQKRSQDGVCRRVMEYFQSDDPAMHEFALAFFSSIQYPPAKPHILKGLKSPDAAVREAAAQAARSYVSP